MGRAKNRKRKAGTPVPPRQSILFHLLCTMTETQLRLLLAIVAAHTRARAVARPDLHPALFAPMEMNAIEMTWVEAMERVASGAMPGPVWPRVLLLAAIPQSFAALELFATECEFMTDVLRARPLTHLDALIRAVNEELYAWLGRRWALPELLLAGIERRYLEGDVR